MNENKFVCFNGEFMREEKANALLPVSYIGSYYFIKELMHASAGKVQFIKAHFLNITDNMALLKMKKPPNFSLNYLEEKIQRLLNANKIFLGAVVKVIIFRVHDDNYEKAEKDINFMITASPLEDGHYTLNKKGLIIDVYSEHKKNVNMLSGIRNTQPLVNVLAGIYKLNHKIDDCVILNEHNHIIETIHSNIILIAGNKLFTPSISDGCSVDIMRTIALKAAGELKLNINENKKLTITDMLTVDEVLLVNSVSGIRWVVAFKQKRYYNSMALKLTNQINKMAFDEKENEKD